VDIANPDHRLKHDGSERDRIAEALMCAVILTRDLDGKLLREELSILAARSIVDKLPGLGYEIVPIKR